MKSLRRLRRTYARYTTIDLNRTDNTVTSKQNSDNTIEIAGLKVPGTVPERVGVKVKPAKASIRKITIKN